MVTFVTNSVSGMLAANGKFQLQSDLYIEPSLLTYDINSKETVHVHISNITTNKVTVNPHSLLCEVQQVTVQIFPVHDNTPATSDVLSKIDLEKNLTMNNNKRYFCYLLNLSRCFPKDMMISGTVHHWNIALG